jgi:hypothetical protein
LWRPWLPGEQGYQQSAMIVDGIEMARVAATTFLV